MIFYLIFFRTPFVIAVIVRVAWVRHIISGVVSFLHNLQERIEVKVILEILIRPLPNYRPLLYGVDVIAVFQVVNSVRRQNSRLVFEILHYSTLHHGLTHLHVDCTQWVITVLLT